MASGLIWSRKISISLSYLDHTARYETAIFESTDTIPPLSLWRNLVCGLRYEVWIEYLGMEYL
jgi:hypothetical protein